MNTRIIPFLAAVALAGCSAEPGAPATTDSTPSPVASVAAQNPGSSAQDAGIPPPPPKQLAPPVKPKPPENLPLCADEPTAKRCISTEEPPPPAAIDPLPVAPIIGNSGTNERWWENRDAGRNCGTIPVYGAGECDCNHIRAICGDGCNAAGQLVTFCVCGGLIEPKRAATWEIPGFAAKYPRKLCYTPDGGKP